MYIYIYIYIYHSIHIYTYITLDAYISQIHMYIPTHTHKYTLHVRICIHTSRTDIWVTNTHLHTHTCIRIRIVQIFLHTARTERIRYISWPEGWGLLGRAWTRTPVFTVFICACGISLVLFCLPYAHTRDAVEKELWEGWREAEVRGDEREKTTDGRTGRLMYSFNKHTSG